MEYGSGTSENGFDNLRIENKKSPTSDIPLSTFVLIRLYDYFENYLNLRFLASAREHTFCFIARVGYVHKFLVQGQWWVFFL